MAWVYRAIASLCCAIAAFSLSISILVPSIFFSICSISSLFSSFAFSSCFSSSRFAAISMISWFLLPHTGQGSPSMSFLRRAAISLDIVCFNASSLFRASISCLSNPARSCDAVSNDFSFVFADNCSLPMDLILATMLGIIGMALSYATFFSNQFFFSNCSACNCAIVFVDSSISLSFLLCSVSRRLISSASSLCALLSPAHCSSSCAPSVISGCTLRYSPFILSCSAAASTTRFLALFESFSFS